MDHSFQSKKAVSKPVFSLSDNSDSESSEKQKEINITQIKNGVTVEKKKLVIELPGNSSSSQSTANKDIAQMIVDDAARNLGEISSTSSLSSKLPIIIANRPKELSSIVDEHDRMLKDISLRPDEPSLSAYRSVPVEQFGFAMLRGMGWDGKLEENAADEGARRPARLGLGAMQAPEREKKGFLKPGEKRREYKAEEVKQVVKKAKTIDINSRVRWNEQEGRVYARLGNVAVVIFEEGKEGVRVPLNELRLIDDEEEQQGKGNKKEEHHSRHRHRHSHHSHHHHDDDKASQNKRKRDRSAASSYYSSSSSSRSDSRRKHGRHHDRDRDRDRHHDRDRDRERDRNRDHDHKRSRHSEPAPAVKPSSIWIRPGLYVRCVSQKLSGGKYFKKKGTIVDVPGGLECTIRFDELGRLDGVHQRDLETVVPGVNGSVTVLRGEHRGKRGTVLTKDVERERASVQLVDDLEIVTLSLDDICQV